MSLQHVRLRIRTHASLCARATGLPGVHRAALALGVLGVVALLAVAAPLRADDPRLGDDVAPTFEAIRLRVDPETADYSGSVAIDLDVRRPTSEVRFHARGQSFSRLALSGGGKPVAVAGVERSAEGLAVARTAEALTPGSYRLEIDFTQPFDTRAVALYRTVHGGRGYAFTQLESVDARGAFPCWDEPLFKIPWQLTVEVPAGLDAVTNTPVESEKVDGAWKTVAFARTPPLPSYLLALAVGAFDFTPIPGLSVPGRIVSPAGQGRLAGLAATTTAPLLASLERYFGQPYPFAKLDLLAVPEFWPGAMENPGAITFADRILLVDPAEATTSARTRLVYVNAHELAHMWFGDLVTMSWWDDLWLNESFADWMAVKVVEEVEPGLRVGLKELQDAQQTMESDARPSSRPIRNPVVDANAATQQVGLAYNKGKTVLAMFETWLGPEVFRRGVVDYLRSRAWGNAVAADFWAALEKASGRNDVASALAGFLDQPGMPLVEVTPLPGGRLRLAQRRYLPRGATAPPLSWTIPMGLKVSDGKEVRTVRVLLTAASQEVAVPGLAADAHVRWVMPNLAGAGYYRWEVPAEMLPALAADAASSLDARERIALLGNLTALLDAGRLPGDRYLEVLATLADDPEPRVLDAVLAGLGRVEPLVPERLEDAFAAYVRRALAPALARFGAAARPGEEEAVALARPDLLEWLGDAGQDEAVVRQARDATRRLLAAPGAAQSAEAAESAEPVDPALAGVSLELAARHGDRALFDELRRRFESAQAPAERARFLSALASFRDPELIAEALRYSLAGPLHANERLDVARQILRGSERGRQQVFDWLLANYAAVTAVLPPTAVNFLPTTAGGCSAERLARAREFFGAPERQGPGMERALARLADQVSLCVVLREHEGPAIAGYLERLAAGARAPGEASQRPADVP